MNGGRFSLIRFSASDFSSVKERKVVFVSDILNSVGVANIRERLVIFESKTHGLIEITSGKPRGVLFTTELESSCNIHFNKPKKIIFSSEISLACNLNKLMSKDVLFSSELKNKVNISKETRLKQQYNFTVVCEVNIGKLIRHNSFFTSIVNSFISVIHTVTETATIDVTIPPGGELRIDSDNFIVLLDGQNVIHLQSGDWITVDRNLLEMVVDTGSGGNLQGQILFNERYL